MSAPDAGESLIAEVRRFVGFSAADEARLGALRPAVLAQAPRIVERFYAALTQHAGAQRVFEGPEQMARLRASLARWLAEAFTGPYDAAYEVSRGRIGQVHVRIGLPQRYMLTAMSVIRAQLHEIAEEAHPSDPVARREARLAVDRLLDMDLALMLETYQLGREEEAVRTYQEIVRATSDVVFTAHPDGRIVHVNRDAPAVPRQALLAEGIAALRAGLVPESVTRLDGAWRQAVADGRPSLGVPLEHRDPGIGRAAASHLTLLPERADGGPTLRVRGILRDVTDLRRLEHDLEERRRLAAVGEMVAGVAHEVRNPLQNVLLALRRLDQTLGPDGAARQTVGQARDEAMRIERLVTDLLSFSRRLALSLSTVEAGVLLDSVLQSCQADFAPRPLPVPRLLAGDPIRLRADPFRLPQALRNLVQNAAEATQAAGRVEISVECPADDSVEFVIADDGPGLPESVRTRLFEPFVTTKRGGTGLGLAIARRLVEAHGGRLTFEPRPGGGTVARVRLPRAGPPA